jgi:hypothetical protein
VVDVAHGTITIPLYLGHLKGSGKNVWYVLTDVDDPNVAAELGLNFSAKLTFASHSARTGNLDANGNIVFDAGTVNFKPERKIIPGPCWSRISSNVCDSGCHWGRELWSARPNRECRERDLQRAHGGFRRERQSDQLP